MNNKKALTSAEIREFNELVKKWGRVSKTDLGYAIARLGLRGRLQLQTGEKHLGRSLGLKFRKEFGQIYATSFSFQRHGIFIEHGVGKGRKKGSGKENPQPWIAVTLPNRIEELADAVGEKYADIVAEARVFIPGIIEGKTKITK